MIDPGSDAGLEHNSDSGSAPLVLILVLVPASILVPIQVPIRL